MCPPQVVSSGISISLGLIASISIIFMIVKRILLSHRQYTVYYILYIYNIYQSIIFRILRFRPFYPKYHLQTKFGVLPMFRPLTKFRLFGPKFGFFIKKINFWPKFPFCAKFRFLSLITPAALIKVVKISRPIKSPPLN